MISLSTPENRVFKIEDLAHESHFDETESSSTKRMQMTCGEALVIDHHTAIDGVGNNIVVAELASPLGLLSRCTEMIVPKVLGTAGDGWKNDSPV